MGSRKPGQNLFVESFTKENLRLVLGQLSRILPGGEDEGDSIRMMRYVSHFYGAMIGLTAGCARNAAKTEEHLKWLVENLDPLKFDFNVYRRDIPTLRVWDMISTSLKSFLGLIKKFPDFPHQACCLNLEYEESIRFQAKKNSSLSLRKWDFASYFSSLLNNETVEHTHYKFCGSFGLSRAASVPERD